MQLLMLACAVMARTASAQECDVPECSGFALSATYTGDLRRNTTGGMQIGNAYNDALDLAGVWTTDSLFPGTRVTSGVSVSYLGGGQGITGELVGDLQGVNNIEAPKGWRLYELWMDFAFGESSNSLRAGMLDLNAEFDVPVTQSLFSGSPFGLGSEFSQTGPVSWPTTGFGLRAAGAINENFRWRVGAYDGAPATDADAFASIELSSAEGALLVGELEYASGRIHKLALGTWNYTADFERVDAGMRPAELPGHGNFGIYAHLDLAAGSIGSTNFEAAVRLGTAASEFNVFDQYAGAAITASHLWAARPDDTLGLGIAWAHTGDEYRAQHAFDGQPAKAAETQIELAYRAELTPWLAILPNVQFVRSPGADPALDDAWIAGFRFEISRDRAWPLRAHRQNRPDNLLHAMKD